MSDEAPQDADEGASDTVQVDADAEVSDAGNGAWVSAWVSAPN